MQHYDVALTVCLSAKTKFSVQLCMAHGGIIYDRVSPDGSVFSGTSSGPISDFQVASQFSQFFCVELRETISLEHQVVAVNFTKSNSGHPLA